MSAYKIIHGDSLEVLKKMKDNTIDAIVSDPPYGISFMGKGWDNVLPPHDIWVECLRVLKPGGYCLAMSATRTYHRLVADMKSVGFENVDMLSWIYGSGFPKATDLSKQFDKAAGAEREVVGMRNAHRDNSVRKPVVYKGIAGEGKAGLADKKCGGLVPIEKPATDKAKQWNGWKYGLQALKPALEPIGVFRKPGNNDVLLPINDPELVTWLYTPKASKSERNAGLESNNHPTCKPIKLMKHLVSLVTPKEGIVLDPFLGSGTTVCAAVKDGYQAIGIEREKEYVDIAEARCYHWSKG